MFYTLNKTKLDGLGPTKKKEQIDKYEEKKVGNIGQIRAIGNERKIGVVRKVPNSFK